MRLKSPILALDLDGVVVDLMPTLLARLTAAGHGLPTWEQPPTFHWTTRNSGLSKAAINFVVRQYQEPDLYVEADPVPGAVEAVKQLRDDGWLVLAVTSRKSVAAGATHEWLERHGLDDMPVVLTSEKAELARAHGFDIAIDDAPHHLVAYSAARVPCIAFDYTYNREAPSTYRSDSWSDILSYLDRMLLQEAHDRLEMMAR